MKKYKWLSETIIGTILCAVILTGVGFVGEKNTTDAIQDKEIIDNKESIAKNREDVEYLQVTQNATHNIVTNIEDKQNELKEDICKRLERLENIILWKFEEQKKITEHKVNYEDIISAENN